MAKSKPVQNRCRGGQPKAMKQGKRKNKVKNVKKDDKLKRGQADSLTGTAWSAWVAHVARVGPTYLFVIFTLCHLLCCRVTEILQIQLKDIDYENNRINVKALKRRGAILKPISATLRRFLDKWKNDGGVSFSYTRKWGKNGIRTFQDRWYYPSDPEQYFFPPKRSDNQLGRMCKDNGSYLHFQPWEVWITRES